MDAIQAPSISNKLKVKNKGPFLEVMDDKRIVWMNDKKDRIIVEVDSGKSKEYLEVFIQLAISLWNGKVGDNE